MIDLQLSLNLNLNLNGRFDMMMSADEIILSGLDDGLREGLDAYGKVTYSPEALNSTVSEAAREEDGHVAGEVLIPKEPISPKSNARVKKAEMEMEVSDSMIDDGKTDPQR